MKTAIKEGKVSGRGHYSDYTGTDRARIGKYTAENTITRACRYFSSSCKGNIPELTARHFKVDYLKKLATVSSADDQLAASELTSIPKKPQGRPLLLGSELDKAIQDCLKALRSASGVVNTAIVMAAAERILSVRCPGRLQKQGGDLQITKDWAKSLVTCTGFEKRKVCNAGKTLVLEFQAMKQHFLADIAAEVIMNDIPQDQVINWDQTRMKLTPTGHWTMHLSGKKLYQLLLMITNEK